MLIAAGEPAHSVIAAVIGQPGQLDLLHGSVMIGPGKGGGIGLHLRQGQV